MPTISGMVGQLGARARDLRSRLKAQGSKRALTLAAAGLALAACGVGGPAVAGGPAVIVDGAQAAFSLPRLPQLPGLPAMGGLSAARAEAADTAHAAVPVAVSVEALEEALFARVNEDRALHGLAPVVLDPQLRGIARERAAAQAAAPAGTSLSHDDAVGPLAFARLMRESGVAYRLAGENLARQRPAAGASASETAALAERALMGSASHRENILTAGFERMAVGVARGADGRVVFAQIFKA